MSTVSYHNGIETQVITPVKYREIYEKYANHAELFTLPQWEVISLYFGQGLTQAQVAKQLDIERRSVGSRLKRAAERLADYQKNVRAEQFRLLRSEIV